MTTITIYKYVLSTYVVLMRKVFAIFATVMFIGIMFYSSVVSAQEQSLDSPHYFEANFPAQLLPDGGTVHQNNLADPESIRTELDIWGKDMGKAVTDGSYVGPIFESSLFEVDYNPLIKNESISYLTYYGEPFYGWPPDLGHVILDPSTVQEQYGTFSAATDRSLLTVVDVVRFSNRMIMSGATEFYVRLPVKPSCISFEEKRPTFCMFKTNEDNETIYNNIDNGNLWMDPNFSIIQRSYPYKWQLQEGGTPYDVTSYVGTLHSDITVGRELYPLYKGLQPQIIQPIQSSSIIDDSMYVHIHGTVEPNTNYIVTFTGILNSKPLVYLTEDDICTNGRQSKVIVTDIPFVTDKGTSPWGGGTLDELTADHGAALLYKTRVDTSQAPHTNETLDVPVDASFSFVFKAGRGSYGMFGHFVHVNKNDAIVFYDTLQKPDRDQYISVMIPIVSATSVLVNITVSLLDPSIKFESRGVLTERQFDFVYMNPYIWQANKNLSYSDFILFTTPYKVNTNTIYGSTFDVRVMVTFMADVDVTFMFSTLSDSDMSYRTFPSFLMPNPRLIDDENVPGSLSLWVPYYETRHKLTYIYQGVNSSQMANYVWDNKDGYENSQSYKKYAVALSHYKTPLDLSDYTVLHYELFRSVQLTDGMWHELVASSEGYQYATHFFERRVAIGQINFWVDTTNNETDTEEKWYDEALGHFSQAWESLTKGDILDAIYHGVMGVISGIWNGLMAFLGWIAGIFKKVWDGLVAVGKFVYSVLSSFVGSILTIIGDIINSLEIVLNAALYVIALLIFMYVMSSVGRVLYLTKERYGA